MGPLEDAGPPLQGEGEPVLGPQELAGHARYRVLAKLGEGAMGVVYQAHDAAMNRIVALKVVRKGLLANESAVRRFAREVAVAARLSHPNTVIAYDVEHAGSLCFLIMEYVAGMSLHRLLQERGTLPVAQACDIVRQAALGLQHAHERNMVHRDIKPHNLMVTASGQVKILDFGLARLIEPVEAGSSLTGTGMVVGTPDFVAPEQARDAHRADIRADIYSLGCTFYYLLTGAPPFGGETAVQKLVAHVKKAPPPLDQLRREVPPELARLVERMLAKEPNQRFQTPAEVAQALGRFCLDRPPPERQAATATTSTPSAIPAARAEAPVRPPAVRASQQRKVFWAALAGALVAALPFFLWRWPLSPAPDGAGAAQEPAVSAGRIRTLSGHTENVPSVVFTPDGRGALTGSHDGSVRLWDLETGAEVRRYLGYTGSVRGVAFSSNGRLAVSGGLDKKLLLWDVATGTIRREFKDIPDSIHGVAFAPNDQYVLCCGYDELLRLWDVETGAEIRRFAGHARRVLACAFSSDSRKIVSGGDDRTVRLWDTDTGQELARFHGHVDVVHDLAIAPDNQHVISGSPDDSFCYWHIDRPKPLYRAMEQEGGILTVAVSPSGRRALTGGRDQKLRLWDLASGRVVQVFDGHPQIIECVAFSPDGGRALSSTTDGTVEYWQLPAEASSAPAEESVLVKKEVGSLLEKQRFPGHVGPVTVACAPNGAVFYTGSDSRGLPGTIRQRAVPTGKLLKEWKGHTQGILCLAASHDGKRLASGGRDETVRIWDTATGKPTILAQELGELVWNVQFSPDDTKVAVAIGGKTPRNLRIYEVASGQLLHAWNVAEALRTARFSPKDPLLALGHLLASQQNAEVWDLETGQPRFGMAAHFAATWALAFAPDGARLITGSPEGKLAVWDLHTKERTASRAEHSRAIEAIVFNAAGALMVTAADSFRWPTDPGELCVWDARKLSVLARSQPSNGCCDALFVPNADLIVTGHRTGEVGLWQYEVPFSYYKIPTRFSWTYTGQPDPGKRLWLRVNEKTFTERYPSGTENTFRILRRAMVENAVGIIIQIEQDRLPLPGEAPNSLQAFIPDKGSDTMQLKYRNDEKGSWRIMATMQEIE